MGGIKADQARWCTCAHRVCDLVPDKLLNYPSTVSQHYCLLLLKKRIVYTCLWLNYVGACTMMLVVE